ncbi:AAA family ATPase [Waterburya agarophytonicola K14]|uniref:AAA family ATPase n=1 Tax=Waterburya agarophytonicola KI4 TaxID=2874699 RepID=A0A964BVA6_9CYAN|nr:bifunctional aminoglycoside phosphotransferase/ATP-binding protein [Waterburya agarophytonicola]MCC0179272.1 AAA family ATPase [Waterburya agarophytonicola KI4]
MNVKYYRLITQMQQSSFYPHAVAENIELIQTHASYIFLTGEYAYKVKKNVNYGFLNYSTLAKRKHFIEAELQLNKKIAPELYLEVVPISDRNSKFILGDSDNIVEYALKMRAFPQEDLFSNLLKERKLSGNDLVELGKIVAHFHNNAKTNRYISSFGTVEKINIAFQENYRQSEKYIDNVQTKEQFTATKGYTDSFLTQRQNLFADRIEQNKIKECHGDLHLRNICLWHDKIQLFDRIEFNESFRFVDTMYDIAFTVMDLEARGHPEFANVFLNSYLEHTGDWTGLLVLPLYLSRQAYVRAKVNSFLLDNPQISEADRQEAKKAASDYYRQAYQYTQSKPGKLILISGLSGSGKSTVAREIAKNIGAIQQARGTCRNKFGVSALQIRSDAIRKHLAGISLDESGTNSIYTPEMTQKTYDRLLELGITLTKAGYTVILDAKYDRLALRQPVIAQAKTANIPLKIIHCTAPMSVLCDRLKQRHNDISDATADLIASQQKKAETFTTAERAFVIEIDTSSTNWRETLKAIQI